MASGVKLGYKDPGYEILIEVGNTAKKAIFYSRGRSSITFPIYNNA